jgi:endothelin-converting enzyme/putative endopeptidase
MTLGQTTIEGSDAAVRPQDDLFGHVNGAWLETAEIAPDLPMAGAAITLVVEAEAQVDDILSEAAAESASLDVPDGSIVQKIGDLYASFLDEGRIERLGARPLDDDLAAIASAASTSELARLIGRFDRIGAGGVLGAYVNTDDRKSDRYVINLVQGGLGLPDEAYYREDSHEETRKQYVAHVAAMLGLLGDSEPAAAEDADRIMALETRLAAGHWDKVASRDVVKTYNLLGLPDLKDAAPNFDWVAWAEGLQAPAGAFGEVIVRQPSYLETLSAALADVPLDDWKAWLRYHVVSSAAPFLSDAFVQQNFDFYSRTLTGTQEMKPRWKRAVALANELLGEAVGEAYVARHFPPEAKAQMDQLVAHLVEAYRQDIEALDWMGPETRAKALAKLQLFRPKIGYPNTWRDYSSVDIRRDDLMGNVIRARSFETDRQFGKLGQPVDRDEWLMNAQTVNAYYNPGTNEICFPAAILRPPFFDPEADPAYNYGGIGAVIGHEIGHGFDDQGSQYDGDGNLVDWWTEDDRAKFTERADKLIEQYSSFEPRDLPGRKVNGALTVGENIGDLGGLQIGLQAYLISLGGAEPPVVDGLTGAQRVFIGWAHCWRVKAREALAVQLLTVDPHSPAEFRANVARNLDEFHEAFETSPEDALWLDPADRVRIW